jgi:hypothetical protein
MAQGQNVALAIWRFLILVPVGAWIYKMTFPILNLRGKAGGF